MGLHSFDSLVTMTLCLRPHCRNADYYEKISDPLDLATIEKQILTGYYKTVEAFDGDMLKVFRNAEVRVSLELKLLHRRGICSHLVLLLTYSNRRRKVF